MEDAGDSSRKTKGRSKSEGGREGPVVHGCVYDGCSYCKVCYAVANGRARGGAIIHVLHSRQTGHLSPRY